jgi:hypothetical protein
MSRLAPSRLSIALCAALLFALGSATAASATNTAASATATAASATNTAASATNTTTKILEACSEGRIPRGYSQQDYRQALRQMPAELAEYSPCPNLIHKAQLAGATGSGGAAGGPGGGPGGAGSVAPPTPAEQSSLESSRRGGGGPVKVGSETLHPGVVHVDIASALSSLPTPLIALLAFLLAGAALTVGFALRGRVRALRLRRTDRGA